MENYQKMRGGLVSLETLQAAYL